MATLFYSMAGEGRGHATRVRALVEELRHEHQIRLFASGDAYDLLEQTYRGTDVQLHRIPGLRFHYNGRHRLSFFKTARKALRYLWGLPRLIGSLEEMIRLHRPDLVITDFEPGLARAAKRCGVPFLSVDHQHFLSVSDFRELPWLLRLSAWVMSRVVNLYYSGQEETIVSSFYTPPLKASCRNVTQVGVMLRPEILAAPRQLGDHLLVYSRRNGDGSVLPTLKSCPYPVKVYGLGARPRDGNLEFCPISEQQFVRDLAGCIAVASNSGNQLVGEALFLEKPVLVMPEANNFEQRVNAFYLEQSGTGAACNVEDFTPERLQQFLDNLDEYRARIDRDSLNGNVTTLRIIRQHLGASRTTAQPALLALREAIAS